VNATSNHLLNRRAQICLTRRRGPNKIALPADLGANDALFDHFCT
jgi:hypothetical protein